MSPLATTIIIKPLLTLNHHPKFNIFRRQTQFSYPILHRKYIKFKKTIASVSMETRLITGSGDHDKCITRTISAFEQETMVNNNNGSVSYHPTAGGRLHALFNRLSKWVVAVTFGGFIMLRHDALALWAATGCISNFILSITLKRMLKQDRPVSEVSSGPGMPSSHAQTLFFTLVFVIISVIEWIGFNGATLIIGILLLALGSYFSWLRVLLGYHTTSQVIAGIVVGSNFAILWFWAWEAIVDRIYSSNPWVQIFLFVGGACYYLGFITYVLWHLIKD